MTSQREFETSRLNLNMRHIEEVAGYLKSIGRDPEICMRRAAEELSGYAILGGHRVKVEYKKIMDGCEVPTAVEIEPPARKERIIEALRYAGLEQSPESARRDSM